MEILKNPYVLSMIAGLVSVIISYCEAKINKIERHKDSYLKIFILSTLVTLLVLFVNENFTSVVAKQIGGSQDILTGNPDF